MQSYPKCLRLMVTAIYADGSSYTVDIKDPVTCEVDIDQGGGAPTIDLSQRNQLSFLKSETPRLFVEARVSREEPLIISHYPTK